MNASKPEWMLKREAIQTRILRSSSRICLISFCFEFDTFKYLVQLSNLQYCSSLSSFSAQLDIPSHFRVLFMHRRVLKYNSYIFPTGFIVNFTCPRKCCDYHPHRTKLLILFKLPEKESKPLLLDRETRPDKNPRNLRLISVHLDLRGCQLRSKEVENRWEYRLVDKQSFGRLMDDP